MAEDQKYPESARYSLALSNPELTRYALMAADAVRSEATEWSMAGISSGARVADIGCGPGAVLRLLAEHVGSGGSVTGVDADPTAVSIAQEQVAGLAHARVRVGRADATGLEPETHRVVMCRHVLAHNGGLESAIVGHLASLTEPGGCVYLVDIDATALRVMPSDPDEADLWERYQAFHRARGNDLSVGLRLGDLLTDAGLSVETYAWLAPARHIEPGFRPPSWAAREAMVADGFATQADVERWGAAFARIDGAERRPWVFPPTLVAVGRRTTA
jgi:SAM-dependent methyltransferase